MTIKAIVLDIDGTLLNSQKEISKKTKDVLIAVQAKGFKLILASGRPTPGMKKCVEELEMAKYGGLIVSYNGASVIDCQSNELLFNKALSITESQEILEHMKNFDVKPMIDKDDYMYVNDVFDNLISLPNQEINIIEYEARGGGYQLCEVADLAKFVDFKLNKILIAGEPAYLLANVPEMKGPFTSKVSSMFTADCYYEFTALGIDKAKALDEVLPAFGIKGAELIAFGDGHNDRSLLEYAGLSVAMANAVPELKALADEVTLSNDQDGIAVMLEKYL
ncbi:Cof-type HAD-IIB family hydrolase [Vagococcus salmoninarum]|uniref:HAD family hydrolase n=1 Tax=Vagococcus salmoninarum TaxID=2739 RepID=A0A429ZMN0_9ENTE|nr:Cof-type HAD-IIB family hydrolase [Vagococcus salmoninarum]RST94962.1 HAD family hydrolase [Vagococcus salmoninarum]